ncbi:MAG: filamentous hemagglutinin, partial [Cyanobacteria bacterium SW_12_48_29]
SQVLSDDRGQAGNIKVTAGSLSVTNGAVLATSTRGQGNAGSVTIDVRDTVEFKGGDEKGRAFLYSGAYSQVEQRGVGQAGDLTITTEQLIVRDRAKVTVSSTGSGNAGELRVEASSIRLENQGKIISETKAGQGGNIALQLQDLLLLREQSQISTTAGTAEAGGDGGNIDIDSDFIVAVPGESSDITANAFAGNGGNIDIDAFSVFGIEPREVENPASNDINDITASSELGLEGTIEIDTPDVDPSRGLVELPTVPVETEVAQACSPGSSQQQSEFVVTGRGGLPPTPEEALSSDAIQVDWVSLKPEAAEEQESREAEENSPSSSSSNPSVPNQIVEAQGWVTAPNGEVVLTASATPGQHPSSWLTPANCHDN